MAINYQNNINIEIDGKKESSMSNENGGVNFNKDVGTANVNTGDGAMNTGDGQMNVADEIGAVDNSQHQGETNITGDGDVTIENQNTIANNGNVTLAEKVKDLFEEMSKSADEQMVAPYEPPIEALPIPGNSELEETHEELTIQDFESFEPDEITDGSDHPVAVYGAIQSYESSGVTPSAEEQKGLFSRIYSSCKKFAQSDTAKNLADTAAGGIELVVGGLPFPSNLIVYLLKKVSNKG